MTHLKMDDNSESNSEYDTDLETECLGEDNWHKESVSSEVSVYLEACDKLGIVPSTRVIHCLKNQNASMSLRLFGPEQIKAIAQVIKICNFITELDFEENGLGAGGAVCLFGSLRENEAVVKLNLARNNLSTCDVEVAQEIMFLNTQLRHLSLAGNKFGDCDVELLACGIKRNTSMEHLDLSDINISETGGQILGRVISYNDTLHTLDLSWNKIRRKGAVAICKGIKGNHCLKVVNLAFNGFGYEGALAVREMLKANKVLESLDISNNRIDWKGGRLIAAGLKHNLILQELKIGHNPLSTTVCVDLLEAAQLCRLTSLNLEGISVTQRALYLAENLGQRRSFTFNHGHIVGSYDLFGERTMARADPEKLFVEYMSQKNLRPLDIFRRFNKINHVYISREQFVQGLKTAQVPLEKYQIEKLLKSLDGVNTGKITYYRLMEMVRAQVKASRDEQRRKQKEQITISVVHKRIIAEGDTLPPIMHPNRLSSRWSAGESPQTRAIPLFSADYSRHSRVTPVSSQPRRDVLASGKSGVIRGGVLGTASSVALHKVISRRQSVPGRKQ